MERTLVLLKPNCVQRGLIGEIIGRFEKKGLRLEGMKMMWLDDNILNEHYAHLLDKPFYARIKESMERCPVVVCCWTGPDAVSVVRTMAGKTNGREAAPGTIRGDYSMSVQENIVHTSDSFETALVEIKRFFYEGEIFDYKRQVISSIFSPEEQD
jgi:Nucleoside diphosphate kinase